MAHGAVVVGTGFGVLTHLRALRGAGFDVVALVGRAICARLHRHGGRGMSVATFLSADYELYVKQRREWTEILVDWETKNQYAVLDGSGSEVAVVVERAGGMVDWGGNVVILGVAPMGSSVEFMPAATYLDVTIMGCRYGTSRPHFDVRRIADLYLAGKLEADAELELPEGYTERAVYLLSGEIEVESEKFSPGQMLVVRPSASPRVRATRASHLAMIGGEPIDGERHLWWNFVSSSRERIERAKSDWKNGRFDEVPGDPEFIPLPEG